MSVDHHLRPLGIHQLSSIGLECLVCTIRCDKLINIQLVLVYRSPNTSFANFANILEQYCNTPTIVMSDFNDANMHSAIYNVMHSGGFTQFVQQPTTDQGSVIIHYIIIVTTSPEIFVIVCFLHFTKTIQKHHYCKEINIIAHSIFVDNVFQIGLY